MKSFKQDAGGWAAIGVLVYFAITAPTAILRFGFVLVLALIFLPWIVQRYSKRAEQRKT